MDRVEISTSERVRLAREFRKVGMMEMADKLGMSLPTYRSRENGSASWRLDELRQIADICGVTIHDLIG